MGEHVRSDPGGDCVVLHDAKVKNPSVSVVVPVHNEGRSGFLQECMRSLTAQTLSDIELIFVDDASTDGSVQLLLEVAEEHSHISVLRMMRNSRQGTAKNRGVSHARGRYIGFVDADDVVDADFYELLYREAMRSGADMVEASVQGVDADGVAISESRVSFAESVLGQIDDVKRKRLIGHTPFCCQCIFRTAFLKGEGRAFPEFMVYEDTPTMLRWIYDVRIISQVKEVSYYYRINPDSTCRTTSINRNMLEDRVASADMMISDAQARGVYEEYKDEIDEYYFKVCGCNTLTMLCDGRRGADIAFCKKLTSHISLKLGKARVRFLLRAHCDSPYECLVWALLWHHPNVFNLLMGIKKRLGHSSFQS